MDAWDGWLSEPRRRPRRVRAVRGRASEPVLHVAEETQGRARPREQHATVPLVVLVLRHRQLLRAVLLFVDAHGGLERDGDRGHQERHRQGDGEVARR